jgi:uncharacterized protein YbjQ (UPF0145 family)
MPRRRQHGLSHPHRFDWHGLAWLGTILIALSGCAPLAVVMSVFKDMRTPAEYPFLEKSRVAVIVASEAGTFANESDVLLGREISQLMQSNISKVRMVSTDEVMQWTREDALDALDVSALRAKLKADAVVLVEVRDLTLRDGPTLYRGRSNSTVAVFDENHGDIAAFRKEFQNLVFPTSSISASEINEGRFKRLYLEVLARRISRAFYPYEPNEDVGLDAKTISVAGS